MAIDPTFVPAALVQTPGYSLTAPFQDLGVVPPGGTHYSVYVGVPRGIDASLYTPPFSSPIMVAVTGSVFVSTSGGYGGINANITTLTEIASAIAHDAWSYVTESSVRFQYFLTLTDSLTVPTWTSVIPFPVVTHNYTFGGWTPVIPGSVTQLSSGSVDNPGALSAWLTANLGLTANYFGSLTIYMEGGPNFDALYNWTFSNGFAQPPPGGNRGVHDSFYTSSGLSYEKLIGGELYPFSAGYPPPGSFPHNGYNYTASETFRLTITDTLVSWTFPTPAARAGNAWVMQDRYGCYHRCEKRAADIRYLRSDSSVPLPGWAVDVNTGIGALADPRMDIDYRDQIHLVAGAGGVSESVSNDNGKTWESAGVALPSGKHGTIACLREPPGTIIRAAYNAGKLIGTVQHGGDASPSAVFTFKDNTGADMLVEDDTFHLAFAFDGPQRIVMAVNILTETTVSDWQCWDGEGRTWTRIV